MQLGEQLAEGKTKIVYAHPHNPALAILVHKDGITAGDGARRNIIPGKGALAGRTAANVLRLLQQRGLATHFVDAPEPAQTIVWRCMMLPIEVVMRRLPAGSYLRRFPETDPQTRFDPPLVEFFLKDDARHDPQISAEQISELGLASLVEVDWISATGRAAFEALEQAWASLEITLVDLKIEFGRRVDSGELLIADVIDNDSWRIWPGGEQSRMLDKQVYRNLHEVTDEALEDIRRRYETVAELSEQFVR